MSKSTKSKSKYSWAFLLILLGACLLRLLTAWGKTFWFDEAISWSFARESIPKMVSATLADNHPPLYYFLLHFWLKFDQAEFFLRLPSLVFGLVSIFLVYQIAKELFSKKIALIAMLIFSLSPLQVYFSAETRMYSLWVMLILVTFHCFLKICQKPQKPQPIYFLLFTIFNLLSFYTHYFSLFFLLALNCFLALKRKKYPKQLIALAITQAGIFLLFTPWLIIFFRNAHPQPWGPPLIFSVPATFLSFALGGVGAVTLKTFFSPSTSLIIKIIFLALSVLLALSFLVGLFSQEKKSKKLLLLLIIFLPVLLVGTISLVKPIYSPRAFVAFSFAFYLLAAQGLEKLSKQFNFWPKILVLGLLVLTVLIQNFYPPFKPQTLKQAVQLIKENSPMPVMIIHTDILTFYPFDFYFGNQAKQYLIYPSTLTKKTTDIVGGTPVLLSEVTQKDKPFLSVTFAWDEKTWRFKEKQSQLKKDFNYRLLNTINDLEIFYYEPK